MKEKAVQLNGRDESQSNARHLGNMINSDVRPIQTSWPLSNLKVLLCLGRSAAFSDKGTALRLDFVLSSHGSALLLDLGTHNGGKFPEPG